MVEVKSEIVFPLNAINPVNMLDNENVKPIGMSSIKVIFAYWSRSDGRETTTFRYQSNKGVKQNRLRMTQRDHSNDQAEFSDDRKSAFMPDIGKGYFPACLAQIIDHMRKSIDNRPGCQ